MKAIEKKTVDAIRILSAEGVQKANSGHPGMPIGAAPADGIGSPCLCAVD